MTPDLARPRDCRFCDGTLEPILDLGSLRISTFRLPEEPPPPTAPLTLARCAWCGLVQLTHTVNPDLLYKGRYWYRSSVNEVMRAELADVVDDALSRVTIDPQDVVVDIGANDGFLLSCYRDHPATLHTLRVGFEPSPNLRPSAQHTSEILIPDYFADGPVFRSAIAGRAKVVTAIAMVYDVDNLESFFSAVHHALHCDGVFVRSREEQSLFTAMVYLNDGFEGGTTDFDRGPQIIPRRGMALLFEHTQLHQGAAVTRGRKYVLRTDVMYRRA